MQKKSLEALVYDLEQELLRLGYTEGSMNFYKRQWKKLLEFAEEIGELYFTESLGINFIEKHFNILKKDFNRTLTQSEVQNLRVIRMLGDFQLHGTVLRRYYKHKEILHNPYFIKVIDEFKRYCMDRDYSSVTVGHYTKQAAKFLDYVDSQSISSCNGITIIIINNYIKTPWRVIPTKRWSNSYALYVRCLNIFTRTN